MTTRPEQSAGAEIVALGRALYDRGITPGRTGNLSVRVGDHVLLTPTGASLGRLDVAGLSLVSLDGTHLRGGAPTKESTLHLALYERFPEVGAVAHGHTTHAVAWSCRTDLDVANALPPLTAYFAMRVGRLPLIGYAPPGDPALAQELRALDARCALLANHGSIASGSTLEAAVDALEEIEETSRIALLLGGIPFRSLTADQVQHLAN
ncbi:MAG: class II aldolase/adducin family protein [Terracoccus sp.]